MQKCSRLLSHAALVSLCSSHLGADSVTRPQIPVPEPVRSGRVSTMPRPVLLIHGFKDDAQKMEPLRRHLESRGFPAEAVTLRPSLGQASLEELAEQVAGFARERFGPSGPMDVVGFSMGGLVARYYVQKLGGADRVRRLVTVASPHHGTLLAWCVPNSGGRQMRPGSAFLRDLNADQDWLRRVEVTSIWTPLDLMILPASSSRLEGARNIRKWVLAHPLMVLQRSCLESVTTALGDET
jgi:triacylglycerol lipase